MPDSDRPERESDGLDLATRRLIEALFRHAPAPTWSIRRHRETFEEAARRRPLAGGVSTMPVNANGVAAEWAMPSTAGAGVVLYLHGGGFVMGSVATTRPLASHLAAATGTRVLYPAYRLAPEHPHPAAVDDALCAYRWLLDQGTTPDRIALAGDSAGCGLVLLLMLRLRSESMPLPAAGICLSPMIDLTLTAPSIEHNAQFDAQAPRWLLEKMVLAYAGTADRRDPKLNAFYADLRGIPPLLIQSGELETVRDDGIRFAERAKDAGVDVTLQVWPAAIHVWHAFAPRLSAANQALSEVGRWLRPRLNIQAGASPNQFVY